MRVALDATPLIGAAGGVPRYVRELHKALRDISPEDTFDLLTDQPVPGAIGPRDNWLERRWWLAGLPLALRRGRYDLFHGTEYSVPYIPVCPSVLSLHDLSPWLDPAWHGAAAARVRQRTPWLLRLGLAKIVLTLSEAVRQQAIRHFQLDPNKVIAIPLAAAPNLKPVPVQPPAEPYLLYVGALEPRKNLPMLVDAWRAIRARHKVRLVLAGRRREDGPKFEPGDGLELPGPIPEDQLAALYSGAMAVVYPTHYEGFGLPVLEAMQCGAPVLTSTDESVVEVAGGAALHAPATDPAAWVKALEDLLANPTLRETLKQKGLARAAQFTWHNTARLTLSAYKLGTGDELHP